MYNNNIKNILQFDINNWHWFLIKRYHIKNKTQVFIKIMFNKKNLEF